MHKILLFGNSASGKSTLAKHLTQAYALAHLDLDTLAWLPSTPPQRRPLSDSLRDMRAFTDTNDTWVIEGCYADLIEPVLPLATKVIFLNMDTQTCVQNARKRPFEPHKYDSKDAQDANLPMLIDWIRAYDSRTDTFSRAAHMHLYDAYTGNREMHTQPVKLATYSL